MTNKQQIKISLDGGVTYQDAPEGVRIIYSEVSVDLDGKESVGELHLNHTNEGMIYDVWGTRSSHLDTHIGTTVIEVDDAVRATIQVSAIAKLRR